MRLSLAINLANEAFRAFSGSFPECVLYIDFRMLFML